MIDTGFFVPAEKMPRVATIYGWNQKAAALEPQPRDRRINQMPGMPSGGGGLYGTAADYFRFAQMLLNGGELDGVRILGRKTVELMAQNHLPDHIPSIAANGPHATGYGLGVSVTLDVPALGRPSSPGTFGWGGAATTVFSVDPVEDLAIVIMAQLMPNDGAFLNRIETLVYQALVDAPVGND
jgi:CubicO group peptidase (beta-lactamase class C family)